MDTVVILAKGDFPQHPLPLRILNEVDTIICCDGAVNNLVDYGLTPAHIIGDMDSITNELKIKYEDKLIHLPDQKENDLRKAVRWAENNGAKETIILGATGKRDDHTLANIFTLLEFISQMEMTIITDFGKFSIVKNENTFDSFSGEQISIFSKDNSIKITSKYLKYCINNNTLNTLYNGSLNESNNEYFSVKISHGQILVYQLHK